MWNGGVRVIIQDDLGRILMVRQEHKERMVWTVPGGAIEEGETSEAAAAREVLEETGLQVAVGNLVWHVEQLVAGEGSRSGQRFVNVFLAKATGGALGLGQDPERNGDGEGQVLRELRFMDREELARTENLYPDYLRDELWDILASAGTSHNPYKIRLK